MATKKKVKAVALAVPAPKTKAEAEALLAAIGRNQRQVAILEAQMNDELAEVKARYEQAAQQFSEHIEADFKALQTWAEGCRDELLDGKSKTAKLATGELSWRLPPPSVRITNQEKVVENLLVMGFDRYLRTKQEVDKQAVLAAPDGVKGIRGISIVQKEEFVAKPFESQIERAEPVKATVTEVA